MSKYRFGSTDKTLAELPEGWKPDKLSPSGAGIWLNCPGSVAAVARMPPQGPAGTAAEDGTRAHLLLNVMFLLGLRPDEVPKTLDQEDVAKAMEKAVAFAVAYVEEWMFEHKGAQLFTEHKVSLAHNVASNVFGTADVIGKHPEELLVMDFKYGMKKVRAKENNQMMLYALGEINEKYRPKKVRLVIIQPRLRNQDPVDEWMTSSAALRFWSAETLEPVVEAVNTLGIAAPRYAGDWCEWCRARGTCPALIDLVFKTAGMDF